MAFAVLVFRDFVVILGFEILGFGRGVLAGM